MSSTNSLFERAEFGLNFQRQGLSYVDLGETHMIYGIRDGVTIDIDRDFFWSLPMDGVSIGGGEPWGFEYIEWGYNGGLYSIFDSASSDIHITALYYDSIIYKI